MTTTIARHLSSVLSIPLLAFGVLACGHSHDGDSPCVVTGCSSHVCAEDHVATTCEWREEYACYRDATCERQANGACGWTETDELLECLAGGGTLE